MAGKIQSSGPTGIWRAIREARGQVSTRDLEQRGFIYWTVTTIFALIATWKQSSTKLVILTVPGMAPRCRLLLLCTMRPPSLLLRTYQSSFVYAYLGYWH